jgi:DNA-binding MarR family transcriptional regulator
VQDPEELRRLASATRALAFAGRALERAVGDMTLAQFRVLSLIASSPERAGELARRAAVSRPSLTGLIDGLAARSWVERSSVEGDRRGVHLEVTAAGRQALLDAETRMVATLERLLGGVAPSNRDLVLDGLIELDAALWAKAHAAIGGTA